MRMVSGPTLPGHSHTSSLCMLCPCHSCGLLPCSSPPSTMHLHITSPSIISPQSGPDKLLEWERGGIQVCPRRELYLRQSTMEHRYRLPPSRCVRNEWQKHQPIYHSSTPAAAEAGDGLFAAACRSFSFVLGKSHLLLSAAPEPPITEASSQPYCHA